MKDYKYKQYIMSSSIMQVIKRNGSSENVSFDKILTRITALRDIPNYELSQEIDPSIICVDTIRSMKDGITTTELDSESAKIASNMVINHNDYGILAARIANSNLRKNLITKYNATNFSEMTQLIGSKLPGFLNDDYYNFVMANKVQLDGIIMDEYDHNMDYFGFRTLEYGYLIKDRSSGVDEILETPQAMLLRVSVAIHMPDIDMIEENYNYMAQGKFTHATPTLFNAGTKIQQMSSCYLLGTDDSLTGIFKTVSDCAQISKWAGGIGIHVSNIRGRNQLIKSTNGHSEGIIPMLRLYNEVGKFINQGGKRRGSIAIYLEPWCSDVLDFLEIRKNGGDESIKSRDLFTALWIPDYFMELAKTDEWWYLMSENECPGLSDAYGDDFTRLYKKYVDEGKYTDKIKAAELLNRAIVSQTETGTPYIMFKDNVNRKSNHSNLGTVKSSNLCVHGDTKVFTKNGYLPIATLENTDVEIWNGYEWSGVTVKKTGTNKNLIRVNFSNGSYIDCTPEHKFYIQEKYSHRNHKFNAHSKLPKDSIFTCKEGKDLTQNDKLIKYELPDAIETNDDDFKYPYTHGFFCGDGTTYYNYSKTCKYGRITLYAEKKLLLENLEYTNTPCLNEKEDTITIVLPKDIAEKFTIPTGKSIQTKLLWFAGYCDADGTIARNGTNESLQISSINYDFLSGIRFMLHTLGIDSKVTLNKNERSTELPNGKGGKQMYESKAIYRLLINSNELYKLYSLGFEPKRLQYIPRIPQSDAAQFIKVVNIEPSYENVDTYCFTEHKRGLGMFNGILTGQCAEIVEYSDANTYAVCNLASIAVNRFYNKDANTYDYNGLYKIAKQVTHNLDKIIDLNYYPTPETRESNMSTRPIGVGVQGFADLFMSMNMPYESDAAIKMSAIIMETIYFGCVEMSCELAKQLGPYEKISGSPFSDGRLQFDLWLAENQKSGSRVITSGKWNWPKLKNDIKKYGMRNSMLTALMPTASTSQILGNTECFEPVTSNLYSRKVLSGTYLLANKYLQTELIKRGLWNEDIRTEIIKDRGSIQNIKEIPDEVKQVYKTMWEIKQRAVIDHALARGPYVDQSQSMNLYFADSNKLKIRSALFYGWENGLKTGSYYLRTRPSIEAQQQVIVKENTETSTIKDNTDDKTNECTMCSA